MPALVLALDAAVAATLVARKHARVLFVTAAAALIAVLIARSSPRLVGDSGEYIAMSLNFARLSPPSLTAEDLAATGPYVPGAAGRQLVSPGYVGRDGRQDFPHFWFYSLLAAPFVRAAVRLDRNPIEGFTALNALLLLGAAIVLVRRYSAAAAAFIVLGPVIWWVDKAHAEVFTVALLAVGVALLEPAPWWSSVAFGAAATQNPPIAAAMIAAVLIGARTHGAADRRIIAGAAAGIALAAMHPLYFHHRLGVWSGLSIGVDRHWPSSTELMAAMTDFNLGVFVHDPFIVLGAAGALFAALPHDPRRTFRAQHIALLIVGVMFVFSFTQTVNFNSGGTPGPSRYGLWLLPLALPALASGAATPWMKALAIASVVWCSSHFALSAPESYLHPTELAARIWTREPQFDNPLAEVFAERVSGEEPAPKLPIATSGCEKVLVAGDGGRIGWPSTCAGPIPAAPSECREAGAICYANKTLASYSFTRAAATPNWLLWERTPEIMRSSQAAAAQAPSTLPPMEHPQPTLWLGDGWSYIERDLAAPPATSTWRWMGESARLDVVVPTRTRLRLRLVLAAFKKARRVRVSLGDVEIATLPVSAGQHGYETPAFELAPGDNSLLLQTLDGTDSPGGKDTRRLSVALFHADLVP